MRKAQKPSVVEGDRIRRSQDAALAGDQQAGARVTAATHATARCRPECRAVGIHDDERGVPGRSRPPQ